MRLYRKNFFLFNSPFQKRKIYFCCEDVLKTKLFYCLSSQSFREEYIHLRKSRILKIFYSIFLKKDFKVPHRETFLIYQGYDSTIYFYYLNKVIKVIREVKGELFKEEFLGYPIHYDFCAKTIPNKSLIIKLFKKHWRFLKTGKGEIHGDFTHQNILVDDVGRVSIIDPKISSSRHPIITDFFYFYAYFMIRLELSCPRDKDFLKREVFDIYRKVFGGENRKTLKDIENLNIESFHFSKSEKIFDFWKNEFYIFMKKII